VRELEPGRETPSCARSKKKKRGPSGGSTGITEERVTKAEMFTGVGKAAPKGKKLKLLMFRKKLALQQRARSGSAVRNRKRQTTEELEGRLTKASNRLEEVSPEKAKVHHLAKLRRCPTKGKHPN